MNILLLCDEYPPGRHGGIGTVVQLQAREMVKQGHRVVVAGFYDWGYGGQDEFDDNGVKVYRFRRRLASKFLEKQDSLPIRAVYRLLRTSGVFQKDIVSSLEQYSMFIEGLINQYGIEIIEMPDYNDYIRFCNSYIPFPSFSVPVVAKLHGSLTYIAYMNNKDIPTSWQEMEHDILKQANAVCAVSAYRANIANQIGEYNGVINVLCNGIDTSLIGKYEKKYKDRVVFTGSLTENKGIYQLIKAWNIVNENMPNAELLLFGKGPIDKIKEGLTKEAQKTVSFMGHVPREELFRYLGESAIAVFPSFAESFALAPMEAMAAGTAVIYTSRTSGSELITDKENGLLIDPADEEEIANKILLLLKDEQLTSVLARKGKQHVEDNFDIKVVVQKHIAYYKSLLAKHG